MVRLKLLLITRNFPPLLGGMERLNRHLAEQLAARGEVTVVGPAGSAAHAPEGVRVIEAGMSALWRFLSGALWQGLRSARRLSPDVVLAGSGLTAPMAWLAARASGARAAVYLHGLDVTVGHPLYRLAWYPILRRMDHVVVNSSATRGLAEGIGIVPGKITVVPPGVALPEPIEEAERRRIRQAFREAHGLGEGPVLLSVGRLTTRKGLLEFVRDVLPKVAEAQPDVQLVIIGGPPGQALAARAQTPERIREAARLAGVEERLHFLGEITDWERLQQAYRAADLHVFPVREIPGDPEGFGMVAIEAAAHGLPTVAYATGGVVDAVADGVSGRLVPTGDSAGFVDRVLELLQRPLPIEPMMAFASGFSWPAFGDRLAAAVALASKESGIMN